VAIVIRSFVDKCRLLLPQKYLNAEKLLTTAVVSAWQNTAVAGTVTSIYVICRQVSLSAVK
jgi:hypothetical protein